jgi:protein CpxP
MNTLRKSFLIGLTVLGMGTVTLAAHADEGRHGYAEMHDAKAGEHMAKHLAALHDKLKLTAAQEPAWAAFVADVKPTPPASRPDRAAVAKMTAPERLEKWIAVSKDHVAKMETSLVALKTLYAGLTPEQQKVFDDQLPGGAHGHRGHRMMH